MSSHYRESSHKSQKLVPASQAKDASHKTRLAKQYGGNDVSGWPRSLPAAWIPYVQLARLSPPAGLFLIYFPHLFGTLLAATLQRTSLDALFQTSALMLFGSFFLSNAIHIWNDIIDAPLDALVERTRNRPIPRGAITPFAATVFTVTQAIGAALILPFLTTDTLQSFLYASPGVIGWTYYPWAKQHTNVPQAVLGFCLAWGIFMGSLATGLQPFPIGIHERNSNGRLEYSMLCMFLANIVWTMIYDTIYAHQDLIDDLNAGIGSLAVLYRDRTKTLLWLLLATMITLLLGCGWFGALGVSYHLFAVVGTMVSLSSMIAKVDLHSSESCWWWFGNGFWFPGGSIAGGLLLEYLYQHYL